MMIFRPSEGERGQDIIRRLPRMMIFGPSHWDEGVCEVDRRAPSSHHTPGPWLAGTGGVKLKKKSKFNGNSSIAKHEHPGVQTLNSFTHLPHIRAAVHRKHFSYLFEIAMTDSTCTCTVRHVRRACSIRFLALAPSWAPSAPPILRGPR